MRVRSIGSCVAVLLIAQASSASAQFDAPRTGSRLRQPDEYHGLRRSDSEAVVAAHYLADCAEIKRPAVVRDYLNASQPGDIDRLGKTLFGRELGCNSLPGALDSALARRFQMPTDIERGMLAEAVLREKAKAATFASNPIQKAYADDWAAVSGRAPAVEDMSICVADTDPMQIQALLATQAGSDAERRAVAAMMPALGNCLVKNASLNANAQSLRAALAEALYHRWVAQSSPAAQPALPSAGAH